jgi:hypothetical protein
VGYLSTGDCIYDIITGVESIAPKIIDIIVINQFAFRSENVCKEMNKRLKGVVIYGSKSC